MVHGGEFWAITVPALAGFATRVTVPSVSPDPARWPATEPWSTPVTSESFCMRRSSSSGSDVASGALNGLRLSQTKAGRARRITQDLLAADAPRSFGTKVSVIPDGQRATA